MTKKLNEKINEYSLNTEKSVEKGCDLLKYINNEVLLMSFEKKDEGWISKPLRAFIESIDNYDPMTDSYEITYQEKSIDGKESVTISERIIPEGFTVGDPEVLGWVKRFIPFSSDMKFKEESLFYLRLKTLYTMGDNTLSVKDIENLISTKNEGSFSRLHYIAAVIDTDFDGGLGKGILSFRINDITKPTKRGNKDTYSFIIKDDSGYIISIPKYEEIDGKWICKDLTIDGIHLGDIKIIDIKG